MTVSDVRARTSRATRPGLSRSLARGARGFVFGGATLLLSGCAATAPDHDPLESFNRSVYAFNRAVDEAAIKPAATLYDAIAPGFLSEAITNFFGNLRDIPTALNDLLQGKVPMAAEGVARVAVNSTLGLAGLIDVGAEMGLEKRNEDFGQTMGVWGIGPGPYVVLPLLGPSSGRDALGEVVDILTDPLLTLTRGTTEYAAVGLRVVDDRAQLLELDAILGTAAMDEYQYVRDAYLQRRLSHVHDGDPPDPAPPSGE